MKPITPLRRVLPLVLLLPALWAAFLPASLHGQAALPQPVPAPGAPVRKLTLDEARQIALSQNKALVLARLNVIEKQYAVSAAKTDYYPKVLGSVTYFHFDQPLGEVLTFGGRRGPRGLVTLPTQVVNVSVLNQDSTLSTIFMAQPITKLIAVNAGVQIARADQVAAQAQADKGTRDVISGVTQFYQGVVGARRITAALELQVKVLDQVLSAKPAPEIKVALIEARQGLVAVRAQEAELVAQLLDLLDLPACTALELVDPLPPPLPVKCAEDAVRLAVANDPEVSEAEQGVAKARAALQVAKMDFLPDVNVLGGYANQTFAGYIQPNFSYVGVTANYTFWGWGKRKHVLNERQTLVEVAQQNVAVTVDKISVETRKTYARFVEAQEAYHLAGEMVKARREVEQGAAGAAALQAKGDTAKAELEEMKAEITYRVAHAKLAAAIGAP